MADSLKVAGVRLVVEGADEYSARLKSASSALTQNAAEMKKLEETYGRNSTSSEYLTQRQEKLTKQLDLQRQRTQALRDTLAAYQKQQDASPEKIEKMNLAITKSEALEARFARQIQETGDALAQTSGELGDTGAALDKTGAAMDKVAGKSKGAKDGIRGVGEEAGKASAKMLTFGEAAIKAGDKMSKMGGKATRNLTLPIVAGFTYASKEAIDFEEAYSGVVKTFRGSAEELAKMRQEMIDLSGSGLVTQNKEEIADVGALANQLGIYTQNVMGFSTAMLQMADATNLTSEGAAEGLAQFANITGMSQKEFSNLGSAIVELGNTSAAQEDAIVNLGMRLAAAGTTAKMSVADIMGISAAFASVGMEAEAGGTAVSKLILDMDKSVAGGAKAAQKYAKMAGMSAKDFMALWKQDSAAGFTAFIGGLQKVAAEGGNVALALEKLGIKDQRMRDAMLRAVNAGDLLTSSIKTSNEAYKENTALAEEAAAKNSTFAARMKVLKNRFDNASMSMGESMMPMLESGMDKLNGLVSAFAGLSEGGKKSVITLGLVTAGIGPLMKVSGNATKAVGFLSKGLGMLGLPGGPVLAAVAGFGALAFAISMIKSPMEQIQQRMNSLEFKFDENAAGKLREGIERGIAAANKEYEITAQVKLEMEGLEGGLDQALKDGKISGKERKSLKKQLDELIKGDIDAAKEELQTSVNSYLATLSQLKTAGGEPLFTEDELKDMEESMTKKTSDLITELEGYQKEYNTLMDVVYKQQEPVTTQQMAEMDALLAQIANVRAQIKTASDEAVAAATLMYELTKEGKGTDETTGTAMGLVDQRQENQAQEAAKRRDQELAMIEKSGLDAAAKAEKAEQIVAKADAEIQAINEQAAASHSELFAGRAKQVAELAGTLDEAGKAWDTLKGIEQAYSEDGGFDMEKLGRVLTPEALMGIGEGKVWNTKSFEQMLANGDPIGAYVMEMQQILSEKIAGAAEGVEAENPLTAYLKEAMGKDIEIDPALAEGPLAALMKVLDFAGRGEEFGLDFTQGIGTALEDPAGIKLVEDGAQKVTDAVDGKTGAMPAAGAGHVKSMIDAMIAAMYGRVDDVAAAAAAISAAGTPKFNTNFGGGGPPDYTLPDWQNPGGNPPGQATGSAGAGAGGNGGNVYVNTLNVRKESDIDNIGRELNANMRRTQAAYG